MLVCYVCTGHVYVHITFYFLMMCLLWVVTNHWIFTEIGHEFVFKCDLL